MKQLHLLLIGIALLTVHQHILTVTDLYMRIAGHPLAINVTVPDTATVEDIIKAAGKKIGIDPQYLDILDRSSDYSPVRNVTAKQIDDRGIDLVLGSTPNIPRDIAKAFNEKMLNRTLRDEQARKKIGIK